MANLVGDKGDLLELFDELAVELERVALAVEVVMVGGAWMLWHTQRAATRDVDSASRLPGEIKSAVAAVGRRRGLAADWLNDLATAFWPATASYDDCTIAYRSDTLTVLVPPARVVFLMKLDRSNPQDIEDMRQLWPLTDFASAEEAAAAYADAYPLTRDEYMANHITAIIG
jgi:hypothetical protein